MDFYFDDDFEDYEDDIEDEFDEGFEFEDDISSDQDFEAEDAPREDSFDVEDTMFWGGFIVQCQKERGKSDAAGKRKRLEVLMAI